MHCGWEGNRKSGVALRKRHLVVLHLRAQGLREALSSKVEMSTRAWVYGHTASIFRNFWVRHCKCRAI